MTRQLVSHVFIYACFLAPRSSRSLTGYIPFHVTFHGVPTPHMNSVGRKYRRRFIFTSPDNRADGRRMLQVNLIDVR